MGLLQKVLSSGAGELIKNVGGVLDNLTTSKEEKLAAQQKIKQLISNHELEMQKQVVSTVLMIFIDAGAISFNVEAKWTDLLQLVLITVIGAYFGGRSLEKTKK